jgi:hypothetical protein
MLFEWRRVFAAVQEIPGSIPDWDTHWSRMLYSEDEGEDPTYCSGDPNVMQFSRSFEIPATSSLYRNRGLSTLLPLPLYIWTSMRLVSDIQYLRLSQTQPRSLITKSLWHLGLGEAVVVQAEVWIAVNKAVQMALCIKGSHAVQGVLGPIPTSVSNALCRGCRWPWSSPYIL